jgi:hypothetical protein
MKNLEKLKDEWRRLARQLSYHNAAEGEMYTKERYERIKTKADFDVISEKLGKELVSELKQEREYLL